MKKITNDIFNKITNANVNGSVRTGKVIAIANYSDIQKICFLTDGTEWGEWLSVSELVEFEKFSMEVMKEQKDPSNISKGTREKARNEETKEQKVPANVFEATRKKAKNDISALVQASQNLYQSIENKTNSDIKALSQSLQSIQEVAVNSTDAIIKTGQDSINVSTQWLNQLKGDIGAIVENVVKTITDYWNKYWLERLISLIEVEKLAEVELKRSKKKVKDLQKEYPDRSPASLAQEIIAEKTVFSTAAGIIVDIHKIASPPSGAVVNFISVSGLLPGMIYQIGIAYGFEVSGNEILGIFALAFSSEPIKKLGLDVLQKQVPFTELVISAPINVAIFQLVGFVACKYYESKVAAVPNPLVSNPAYETLKQLLNTYLAETLSEEDKLNSVVTEAVAIREELKI